MEISGEAEGAQQLPDLAQSEAGQQCPLNLPAPEDSRVVQLLLLLLLLHLG